MHTAMTTFARGVPAPKRAVGAFTSFEHAAINRKAIVATNRDDVRSAIKAGRKLVIGEKTIVTPAARELGEERKAFIDAGWPS